MATRIQWTQNADGSQGTTWNPVPGCMKVSPGCKNCYAIRHVLRMAGNPNKKIRSRYLNIVHDAPNWTGKTSIDEEVLLQPLRRKKPTTYFISLSDLFYDGRPDIDIDRVFAVMALAHWHTFQVLTKYEKRMASYFDPAIERAVAIKEQASKLPDYDRLIRAADYMPFPHPNVWLGVSVEDQKHADERIPLLLRTPAALRFVSYEPALGPVDFRFPAGASGPASFPADFEHWTEARRSEWFNMQARATYMTRAGIGLDWIIVGAESGPGARPCDVAWVRSVVKQCRDAGVPCFVKQLGAQPRGYSNNRETEDAIDASPFDDSKGGDPSEWPEDLRVREMPEVRHAD